MNMMNTINMDEHDEYDKYGWTWIVLNRYFFSRSYFWNISQKWVNVSNKNVRAEWDLTHFQPLFHFYTPWKHQKTGRFLMFSGGIEVEHCLKTRKISINPLLYMKLVLTL